MKKDMKNLKYFLVAIVVMLFYGCDQDIDFPYSGKDRIQFRHYTTDWNGRRHYSDSLVFSFGLLPDSVEVDTAKVVMEFLGRGSDRDRTYKVVVVPDSTNAAVGVHYEAIDGTQLFRAGQQTDTLRIVVCRKNPSTSFRHPETTRIDLKLEPADDFGLGLGGGTTKKILPNNYLSEPDWWNDNTGLGHYHPEKWKILISFNSLYANRHTCPFDINNEGRTCRNGLANYLQDIPAFDSETGDRLYMNEMVPQE